MEYPDRHTITTPEGTELDLALAGIGSRFIAAMLDVALQAIIGLAGAIVLVIALDGGPLALALSVGAFLLLFTYDVAFEVLAAGRTPGKRATGLRVVRESGAPVDLITSAIRNVMRLVDILPAFYAIAMVSIFITRRDQRLGDLAAGTIVVRERLGGRGAPAPTASAPVSATAPAGWDVSAVTAEDLAVVRAFIERRATLEPGPRTALAADLAGRLRPKVAGAPVSSPEDFLEALVAARG